MNLKVTLFTILIISVLSFPCFAIDFSSNDPLDSIIKSINEEPDNWIIRSNGLYYVSKDYIEDAKSLTWPEQSEGCIVQIAHTLFRGKNGYIIISKPFKKHLSDENYDRFVKIIRQLMYNELHNKYNIRMPKKKVIYNQPQPLKKEKIKETNEFTKL